MLSFSHRLRLALRLQAALAKFRSRDPTQKTCNLDGLYRSALASGTRLEQARRKGWRACVASLLVERLGHVKRLQAALNDIARLLDEAPPLPLTLRDWLAEIEHLEAEFDGLRVDWKERSLLVTTDAIILDDVELGPFAISLRWERLAQMPDVESFDIVALDPNPAVLNDEVTHPHVRDRTLCAGDATMPIRRALEQGRIADAFLLVRSVLVHYNPNSAHVALDQWQGHVCGDCGQVVGDDDRSWCEGCDQDYCDDCVAHCHVCSHLRCNRCLGSCADCEERCCPSCLDASEESGRACCRHCLDACAQCEARVARSELDETDRCSHCRAAAADDEHSETTQPPLETPNDSLAVP